MTFTFTDNRGINKRITTLDTAQLAAHLANDKQFMYYWRNGWDPCLAANRSLYMYPPDPKATVFQDITPEQWVYVEAELSK